MRIFKNRAFEKWSKEQKLKDDILKKVVEELEQGLYEANLGSNVYKKRMGFLKMLRTI